MNIRLRVRTSGTNGAPGRMGIWKRPMDQIKIEIIELEIAKGLFECRPHVVLGMFVIP
jgi:hypothetical protein